MEEAEEKDVSSTTTTPQPELKGEEEEEEEEEPRRMLRKRLLVQDQGEEGEALAVGDRLPPPSSQSLLLPLVNDTFDRLKSSSSSEVSQERTLFESSHEVGLTYSEKTQTSNGNIFRLFLERFYFSSQLIPRISESHSEPYNNVFIFTAQLNIKATFFPQNFTSSLLHRRPSSSPSSPPSLLERISKKWAALFFIALTGLIVGLMINFANLHTDFQVERTKTNYFSKCKVTLSYINIKDLRDFHRGYLGRKLHISEGTLTSREYIK